jgi:hypothetical protein
MIFSTLIFPLLRKMEQNQRKKDTPPRPAIRQCPLAAERQNKTVQHRSFTMTRQAIPPG